MSDFGTPELKQHCKLKIVPAKEGVSNGGQVIAVALKNETSDLLDRLFYQGYLKAFWEPESAGRRRYDNGLSLQALYAVWHSQGKDPAAASNEYRVQVTLEGHIGSERDIAETVFNKTMINLGPHASVARQVCIDGFILGHTDLHLRRALDAIPRAMEMAEDMVKRSLENRGL